MRGKLNILFTNKTLLLFFLISLHIFLHLFSTRGDNFYFTVDQARDALEVRDILWGKRLPPVGPATGAIENLFVGPLWYFLLTPPYWLFAGNPWGAVFMMVFLNSLVVLSVFKFSRKYLSSYQAFLLTLGLIFFERFWFSSQFSLNPHLLPLLTLGQVLSLVFVYEGKRYWLVPAAVFTGLVVHSELAFIPIAFLTYFLTSIYFLKKGKITLRIFFFSTVLLTVFLIPHLIYELQSDFSQVKAVVRAIYEPLGIIGKTSYRQRLVWITEEFVKLFSQAIFPQSEVVGSLILLISMLLLFFQLVKKRLKRPLAFLFLITTLMIFLSLIWFLQTKEFLPWHMLGMYSLVFVVLMLCLASLKSQIATILFFVILFSQIANFLKTYPAQLKASSDHGLFINQLAAIDWIYREASGEGFSVYSYLKYVYDYPYQYTIWWRGTYKYGYLPCEYSTYPGVPSSLYLPSIDYYQEPKRSCQEGRSLRFLIIEPTDDRGGFETWYNGVTRNSRLLKSEFFGNLRVEKRTPN